MQAWELTSGAQPEARVTRVLDQAGYLAALRVKLRA